MALNSQCQLGKLFSSSIPHGLTCGSGRPRVTVRDRSPPGLIARLPARRIKSWALIALVLAVFRYWRERATPPWGFILSPSATLRVAGQVC